MAVKEDLIRAKRQQNIFQSFNCAIEGFIYVMKTERNMRIHFLVTLFILLLGIYFNFTRTEMLLLLAAITFVLLSEMFNTSVELIVDMISGSRHSLAEAAKDVAAGAVFISSLNAVVVAYLLFSKYLPFPVESGLLKIRHSPWHITFISLILVMGVVVMTKVFFHKGTPLRGGMPSGHSAVAFSMWMIIALIADNGLITVLTFVMAVLIARSRMKEGIHNVFEVFAGAVVGALMVLMMFQLLA